MPVTTAETTSRSMGAEATDQLAPATPGNEPSIGDAEGRAADSHSLSEADAQPSEAISRRDLLRLGAAKSGDAATASMPGVIERLSNPDLSGVFQRPVSRRSVLKVSAGLLATAAIAWACGPLAKSSPSQKPDATPPPATATATEAPTSSPTEAPTPVTAGFTQNPDGTLVWKGPDASGKEIDLNVPAIPGLQAVLEGGKVTYVALDGNRYGLKVDGKTEAAEYSPDVSVEGTLVGGLALEAHVANWYLQNTADVNGIPPIISPVDFRTATGVSINKGTMQASSHTDIVITIQGNASVTDVMPGTRELTANPSLDRGTCVSEPDFETTEADRWAHIIYYAFGLPPIPSPDPIKLSLGQAFEGVTTGPVSVIYTTTTELVDTDVSSMIHIANSVASVFKS